MAQWLCDADMSSCPTPNRWRRVIPTAPQARYAPHASCPAPIRRAAGSCRLKTRWMPCQRAGSPARRLWGHSELNSDLRSRQVMGSVFVQLAGALRFQRADMLKLRPETEANGAEFRPACGERTAAVFAVFIAVLARMHRMPGWQSARPVDYGLPSSAMLSCGHPERLRHFRGRLEALRSAGRTAHGSRAGVPVTQPAAPRPSGGKSALLATRGPQLAAFVM